MLAIQEDVKIGNMPKGGPELPDNELAIVSGWVGDHAPEIAAFLAQGIGLHVTSRCNWGRRNSRTSRGPGFVRGHHPVTGVGLIFVLVAILVPPCYFVESDRRMITLEPRRRDRPRRSPG
jgi:hypothetical protein